jgi:hypothetical protein
MVISLCANEIIHYQHSLPICVFAKPGEGA